MDRLNSFKLFFDNHKNKIFMLIILLIVLFISIPFFLNINNKTKSENKIVLEELDNIEKDDKNIETDFYFVDVKGCVNSPGVYPLEKGKRVVDALSVAGGLTDDADTSLLNLSMLLTDQMVIKVYSKSDTNNISEVKEHEVAESKKCDGIIVNDACQKIESSSKTKEKYNTKININTSSKEELMTLSKIGQVKALAIIEYRNNNGNFKSIDEIKNVKGIGDSLFNAIKNNITI